MTLFYRYKYFSDHSLSEVWLTFITACIPGANKLLQHLAEKRLVFNAFPLVEDSFFQFSFTIGFLSEAIGCCTSVCLRSCRVNNGFFYPTSLLIGQLFQPEFTNSKRTNCFCIWFVVLNMKFSKSYSLWINL